MKKIIPLMILIITIGCSQYSSYDECFVNEMAKMPEGLDYSSRDDFVNSASRFCRQFGPIN